MTQNNQHEKKESVLEVGKSPFVVDPLVMYYEALKNRRVRVEVGRDRFEGILLHAAFKLDYLVMVSTDKTWIEYNKTFRNEDLAHIPGSLIKAVTMLEDEVHEKIREERIT